MSKHAILDSAEAAAARFAQCARAPATRRGYAADWRDFAAWCQTAGLAALPATPRTVALYLAGAADRLKVSTLQRRLAAITATHHEQSYPFAPNHPEVASVWKGIRRTLGTARHGKQPILSGDLAALLQVLPMTLAGRRDRAILALGFAAALRRSEVAALEVSDLTWTADGLLVRIGRGKTDSEAKGALRAVPLGRRPETCPVAAVRDWVLAARLDDGPLFRPIDRCGRMGEGAICDRTIARIVKAAIAHQAAREGLTRAEIARRVAQVSGHSLRSGFATSAASGGASEAAIMRQTGHRKRDTLQGYIRPATAFADHPAHHLDL